MRKFGLKNKITLILSILFILEIFFQIATGAELEEIQRAIQEKGANWVAGETSMSKLPLEERRLRLGLLLKPNGDEEIKEPPPIVGLPSCFDWRDNGGDWVTPIKDQGACGSCWAFATVGATESLIRIAQGNPNLNIDLSEQFLVSCDNSCYPPPYQDYCQGGCDGGYLDLAAEFSKNTGVPDENCFPYAASDIPCSNRCSDWASRVKKIDGWSEVCQSTPNVATIKNAVYENPIQCGMTVYEDFYYYDGGVYEHVWGEELGGHAVIIVGWDDSSGYWICKNSWSTGWGENGFFRIKWNDSDIGTWSVDMDVSTITDLCVCPGDTNNDGEVNISDVLPIGLFWLFTGPARQNPSSLDCQFVQPWDPEDAAYADANGDGIVDNKDILPIGFNWGKSFTGCSPALTPPLRQMRDFQTPLIELISKSVQNSDEPFTVDIKIDNVSNLFGIAFVLQYTNIHDVDVLSVERGDFLEDDVLFYPHIDRQNGLISIGISRKYPDVGVSGSGVLATVRFQSRTDTYSDTGANLTIQKVTGKDPSGNAILLGIPVSPVSLNRANLMPHKTQLLQNFPNPFNPETWIPFQLAANATVHIRIYDTSGQLVRVMKLGEKPRGVYTTQKSAAYWDGRNARGEPVASGVYFYTLQAGNFCATRKMIIVR